MATNVPVSVQFDPELPLFIAKVKGHTVEIYFNALKWPQMWKLVVDADEFDCQTLHYCFGKAEEICKQRFNREVDFYFPAEE